MKLENDQIHKKNHDIDFSDKKHILASRQYETRIATDIIQKIVFITKKIRSRPALQDNRDYQFFAIYSELQKMR